MISVRRKSQNLVIITDRTKEVEDGFWDNGCLFDMDLIRRECDE